MNKLVIFGNNLAKEVAIKIGAKFVLVENRVFPDGEIKPRLQIAKESRFKTAILILEKGDDEDINRYLFKFLLLSRKLRDCSKKVVGIMPYLPYARQDRIFQPGDPLSAKYAAELIEKNLDVFATVNMHEHRQKIGQIFSIQAYNLSVFSQVAARLSQEINPTEKEKIILVGPDEEAKRFVDDFRKELALDYVILEKKRDIKTGEVSFCLPKINLKNKEALIIDDIASSSKTLIKAANLIKTKGASRISFIICHGLFIEGGLASLKKLKPRRLIVSNTVVNSAANYDISEMLALFIKNLKLIKNND